MNLTEIKVNSGDCFTLTTYTRLAMGYVPKIEINNVEVEILDEDFNPVDDIKHLIFKDKVENQTLLIDKNTSHTMGGSSELKLNFKALQKGSGLLHIIHYRPWSEDEDQIIESYQITIA